MVRGAGLATAFFSTSNEAALVAWAVESAAPLRAGVADPPVQAEMSSREPKAVRERSQGVIVGMVTRVPCHAAPAFLS